MKKGLWIWAKQFLIIENFNGMDSNEKKNRNEIKLN